MPRSVRHGPSSPSVSAELAAVFACVRDPLVLVDRAGRGILMNEAARALVGRGRPGHAVRERGGRRGDSPADIERVLGSLRFVDGDGGEYSWEEGPVRWALQGAPVGGIDLREVGSGPVRHLQMGCTPVRDESGMITGAVITLRDLTALHTTRERLEAAADAERRRASQLRVLNQLVMSLNVHEDPGSVLDEVVTGALRLTGAGVGAVYLPERGSLRLEAFVAIPELRESPHGAVGGGRLDLKEVAQRAADEGRSVRVAEELPHADGRFLGYLSVPLFDPRGTVLACLAVAGSPDPIGFSAEDEVFVTTLAAHTAVALENLKRLAGERGVAEYLQRAMLPTSPKAAGLVIDHVYRSATDATLVGGDFYDVIPIGPGKAAAVVGDVCGKGLRAATSMSYVRHVLRAHASMGLEPGPWLEKVNDGMPHSPDETSFVTVALVVVDVGSGEVTYALAGHPAPLVAGEDAVRELPAAAGLPLGVRAGERYETKRALLGRDETLCLFTDGLFEARRGPSLFGDEGLAEELLAATRGRLGGAAARLVERARDFAGGSFADDVVVLMVRLGGA